MFNQDASPSQGAAMAKKPKTAQRVKFQLLVPVISTAHAPSAEDFD